METPSFYKILMDLPSHLGVPQGFTEKYPELLTGEAKLRTASGDTWEVRVEKVEDHYFFTKGWTSFLQEMGLQRFELLVFSYAGDSTFHVTVYAADAYEKDSNFRVCRNPRFEIPMREYQHYRLVEESFFEAAGLRRGEKVVVEYPGGKSVEVAVYVWMSKGHSVMGLGTGWKKFWDKNKIIVGKTYSFEFLPEKKVIQVKPKS